VHRRPRTPARIVLLAALATGASAEPIGVANPGFETPAQSAMGDFASGTPPGWSVHDPGGVTGGPDTDFGVWWPLGFFDYASGAQEGLQCGVVYLDLAAGTGVAGLAQTLPAVLEVDTRYTLEVYVGDPTDYSDPLLAGFPGYLIELRAGGHLVVSDDDSATLEGQFRPARATLPVGRSHPGLGQPLEIRLLNRNAAAGAEVDFDAVSVDATAGLIESYAFTVTHDGGSLAGLLVYDRERSAATQTLGRDASLTITEATGDLAAFAAIDFDGGFASASGTILNLLEAGGTGNFLSFRFGQSLSLDQPLPVASFLPATSAVHLSSVVVAGGGEPDASFTLPEADGAAGAALAALCGVRLSARASRRREAPSRTGGTSAGTSRSARRAA
jgi:hypothetical protein